MRRLLKNIDTLYTCDDGNRILRQAWIIIDGANLAAVGVGASPEGEFDDTLDMAGSVVTPGLINTHHHFFRRSLGLFLAPNAGIFSTGFACCTPSGVQ
jgi:cytosine/adenosine deaminase-related metal-dependent hydrolase